MRPSLRTLSALAAVAIVTADAPAQGAPSRTETTKLIKSYLALDGRTAEGWKERKQILARLDLLPPLSDREVKDWKKKIAKQARKLPKLEKSGRNWFWEKEERGLYYVGGETKKPKGLLIGLHGGGKGSGDAGSSHSMYNTAAKKLDWVTVCPEVLEKTEHGWTDSGTEEYVLALVDAAMRTWKLDPNHVYFAGHSMGGYGSWTLGAHHADRIAGAAPSAGAPTPLMRPGSGEVFDIVEGIIPNLRNIRMLIFQSTDDPKVAPEPNQVAVKKLGEAQQKWGGYDFEYWEVDNRGHGLPSGGALALLEKIAEAERNPIPERITWQPMVRWKRQFYWLWWDELYTQAMLQADLDRDANTIRVQCENARKGLHVLVDERMVDLKKEVVIELNGKEVYRGTPEQHLSTLLLTTANGDTGLTFTRRVSLFPDA